MVVWRKAALPALLILFLVLLSVGALKLASGSQRSLEGYRSPYGAASEPAFNRLPPLEPLTGRVVLVVVDGLRNDVSQQMPFLSSLRRQGAWTELTTRTPSYSKPGYAILLTGTWPEVHGVTLNAHSGPVATDHLLERLHRAGLRSSIIGDEWWGELSDGRIDYPYLYPDASTHSPTFDRQVLADALQSLKTDRADFTLVHLTAVDDTGHRVGGGSPKYLQAAREADDRIRRIAGLLDWSKDTLLVTADHGHLTRNNGGASGHGGNEPEVLTVPWVAVGRGIRPGRLQPGEVVATAPTVAALLGIASPLEAAGNPRWDALSASDAQRSAWLAVQAAETVEYAKGYLGALQGRKAGRIDRVIEAGAGQAGEAHNLYLQGRFGEAIARAEEARSTLLDDLAHRRTWALWSSRLRRIPAGLGFLLLGLAVVRLTGRMAVGLAASLLVLLLDAAGYQFLTGHVWSLSALPGTGVLDFLRIFALPEYLALALVSAPFLLLARRRPRGDTAGIALALVAGLAAWFLVVTAVGYVANGFSVGRFLPDFRLAFLQLTALLQLGFLLPAVLLLPAAALIRGRRAAAADPPVKQGEGAKEERPGANGPAGGGELLR